MTARLAVYYSSETSPSVERLLQALHTVQSRVEANAVEYRAADTVWLRMGAKRSYWLDVGQSNSSIGFDTTYEDCGLNHGVFDIVRYRGSSL